MVQGKETVLVDLRSGCAVASLLPIVNDQSRCSCCKVWHWRCIVYPYDGPLNKYWAIGCGDIRVPTQFEFSHDVQSRHTLRTPNDAETIFWAQERSSATWNQTPTQPVADRPPSWIPRATPRRPPAVALFATSPDLVFCLTDAVCLRPSSFVPLALESNVDKGCRSRKKKSWDAAPRQHPVKCRRHATILSVFSHHARRRLQAADGAPGSRLHQEHNHQTSTGGEF
jgi:hypothetical protein